MSSALDPMAAMAGALGGGGMSPDPMAAPQGAPPLDPSLLAPPPEAAAPEGDAIDATDDPDELTNLALKAIRKILAGDVETDHEDQVKLEKATSALQDYLAGNQKLTDSAMGAGPGEKFVRKQASRGAAGGGY